MMSAVGKLKDKKISCIPNNMEKYISCSLDSLRLIYSLQFLNATLDTVVSKLSKEGGSKFQNVSKHYPRSPEKGCLFWLHVLLEPFSRSRVTSHLKIGQQIVRFRSIRCWWQTFGMCIMGDYHDLYLKTDGLLLTDVFENFRDICLKSCHLDPTHFYTSPGQAWEDMLKMTKVKFQLFNYYSKILF